MRGLQRLLSKGVCTLDSAFRGLSLVEVCYHPMPLQNGYFKHVVQTNNNGVIYEVGVTVRRQNIASFLYWQGCTIRPKAANFCEENISNYLRNKASGSNLHIKHYRIWGVSEAEETDAAELFLIGLLQIRSFEHDPSISSSILEIVGGMPSQPSRNYWTASSIYDVLRRGTSWYACMAILALLSACSVHGGNL